MATNELPHITPIPTRHISGCIKQRKGYFLNTFYPEQAVTGFFYKTERKLHKTTLLVYMKKIHIILKMWQNCSPLLPHRKRQRNVVATYLLPLHTATASEKQYGCKKHKKKPGYLSFHTEKTAMTEKCLPRAFILPIPKHCRNAPTRAQSHIRQQRRQEPQAVSLSRHRHRLCRPNTWELQYTTHATH